MKSPVFTITKIVILGIGLFQMSCATSSNSYRVPKYEEIQLKNGLRVLFFKDNKLPYISMSMLVKAGSLDDDPASSGVSSMVAGLLKKGTQKRSATEIADDFGQLGASFSASANREFTSVQVSGLSQHSEVLLKSFAEIILKPAFSTPEVRRYKERLIGSIKRSTDNNGSIASRGYSQHLFPDHSYGRPIEGTLKTIAKIRKKDIFKTYLRYYRPNNSTLAVIGNYPPETIQWVRENFEAWTPRKVKRESLAQFPEIKDRDLLIVNKEGVKQAQIRLGFHSIRRSHPDYLKLKVANAVLSEGFLSRLMTEIRVKRGLSYSAGSYIDARKEGGAFSLSTFTKNKTAGETLKIALKVLEDFHRDGITAEELATAKGYLKGQFPRIVETPEKLASNILVLDYYGIGEDYLNKYMSSIEGMSLSVVNSAIKTHLNPKDVKILILSDAKAIKPQFKDYKPKVKPYSSFL